MSEGDLISSLPRQLEIEVGSPLVHQAEEAYSRSIEAIIEIAERSGVPLLVCNPVSNLRDQSPRLPDRVAIDSANDASEAGSTTELALTRGRARERPRLEEACRLDPNNAALHYRLAQAYEEVGYRSAALGEYFCARELDVCRYRAPSSFRNVLTKCVAKADPSRARFLDLEPAVEAASKFAAPGSDLFLEHVHFNLEGHWLMARLIGRAIVQDVLDEIWKPELVPGPAERDQWLGVIPEDRLTAVVLAWFMTKDVPFDRAADAARHQDELEKRMQALRKTLSEDQARRLFDLPHQTKIDDLVDGLGRALVKDRAFEEALDHFRLGARRRPWMPNSDVFAAECLHRLGRFDEAAEALERADRACLPPTPALLGVRRDLDERLKSARPKRKT